METLISIFLGIFQGITEFFPVSSSGHLAFFQKLFGTTLKLTKAETHLYNVMVHFATVLAVILVFKNTLINLIKSLFVKEEYKDIKAKNNIWLIVLIITATIPTGIIGILGRKFFIKMEDNLLFIGMMFFVTAVFLIVGSRFKSEEKNEYKKIGIIRALIIGIVQGIAVSPGISRSGSTISTARMLNISREKAGEFSFLMSIPAILGAMLLEMIKSGITTAGVHIFIAGFLSAFIAGYFSLKFLLIFIRKGKLYWFAYYVALMGIISIVLHWRGL
jgi:undecaprenyl-diphosphatase